MQIGTLVRRTRADHPSHVGLLGIVIKEYQDPEMIGSNKTLFVVLWSDGQTGRGWRHNSWGMEIICK